MKTTWIMQNNMGSISDIGEYIASVKKTGANVIEVQHIPFSEEVPDINVDGPLVVYGAVSFITAMQKSEKYSIGIFGNSETFTYENWSRNYGSMLLNSPDSSVLMTIKDFSLDGRNPDDDIFVRPQHDTKSLVGRVYTAKEFYEWSVEACKGDFAGVSKDTPIVVAKPYGIAAEWRLFIADKKVVGSSQYHKNGRLFKEAGAPTDVLEFANKVINTWNPTDVYTLDLCKSAGNCYIVEAQGFNSAGAYACDIESVAKAVNDVAVRLYLNEKTKAKRKIM